MKSSGRPGTSRLGTTSPGTPLRSAAVPNTRCLQNFLAPAGQSTTLFKHLAGTRKRPSAPCCCRQCDSNAFWTARRTPGDASKRLVVSTAVVLKGRPGLVASRHDVSGRPHNSIFSNAKVYYLVWNSLVVAIGDDENGVGGLSRPRLDVLADELDLNVALRRNNLTC